MPAPPPARSPSYDVLGSRFTEQNNLVMLEYAATGMTALDCMGSPLHALTLDVWEHAFLTFPVDGGSLSGRVEMRLMIGDDAARLLGRIDGRAVWDPATETYMLDLELQAHGLRGTEIHLSQIANLRPMKYWGANWLIDTSTGEILWADDDE